MSLRQAMRHQTWWLAKGQAYRTDRTRRLRLSGKTLARLFYRWRKAGRTEAVLALRYRPGLSRLSVDQVKQFGRMCLAPGCLSLTAAFRALPQPGATYHAFRHALPPQVRAAIGDVHNERRRDLRLEKNARRVLAGWDGRRV